MLPIEMLVMPAEAGIQRLMSLDSS